MILKREDIVKNIKDCGHSLIENAEQMVGDYKFFRDVMITCWVNEKDEAPYISVDASFIPENWIERMTNND